MERVKNWRVLHNLSGTMKNSVSEIWKICNHLTAFLPPLHAHDSGVPVKETERGDDDDDIMNKSTHF